MATIYNPNSSVLPVAEQASSTPASRRDAFVAWLSDGNAKKFHPQSAVACLDRISEYVISKKISCSIWEISNPNVYKPVYQKVMDAKLLRIMERNTYKTFTVVGQLYAKFLKEKAWGKVAEVVLTVPFTVEVEGDELQATAEDAEYRVEIRSLPDINTDDVIAWLVTQHNTNGTHYLDNVLRSYISALRNAPLRLTLNESVNRNVFACHTVNELDNLWQVYKAAPDYVEVNRTPWHGQLSAGLAVYRRYLEHLEKDGIVDSVAISGLIRNSPETGSMETSTTNPLRVDFNHPELCAKTKPISCTIYGQEVEPSQSNWAYMLAAITERLIFKGFSKLADLYYKQLYGGYAFFTATCPNYGQPMQLSDGRWINTQYSAPVIVTIIKNLCLHCDLDLNDVVITYEPRRSFIPALYKQATVNNTLEVDEDVASIITEILGQQFPNGIRPNSVIDTNKLRNYYSEATGRDIAEDISDIAPALETVGIKHGEKVFAVSESGKNELAALFNRLLFEDNRLFYYDELYDAHAEFLEGLHIFSAELLRTVLSELSSSVFYYKNYCQTDRSITVESEILRCFEFAACQSYEQLKKMLPYVPITIIRQVLAQNSDFVWVNTGVYTHLRRIEFDKLECEEICNKIAEAVSAHGFASLATADVWASSELNPELSETAIKNGLYQAFLSDNYEKRGNIVTKKGTVLSSVAVFEDFCRSHDRLSLDELLEYEKEINGDVHNQSLFVAYDNMIRIDRDTFVADNEIQFDVEATDAALARFVYDDVIPIRSVTSFTSFPLIDGYPWNWFLLESYSRRFSKHFRFQCLSVSSRNVGAIYKKSVGFADYAGVLASAVAAEPVKLNQKEVGDFLFESGYIARRTSFVADVVAQARLIRERRV